MKLLQNISTKINSNKLNVLKYCYIFVFCVIIIYNLLLSLYNYINLKPVELSLYDFNQVGAEIIDDSTVITATADTQLIYESDKPILNLYFNADTLFNVGEWILFYQNDLDKEFSVEKQLYAKYNGEEYYFSLPINTKKIRFDLGVTASNTINFYELVLNKSSFNSINAFESNDLFNIFVLPLVLYSIILLFNDLYLHLNKFLENRRNQ